MAGQPFPDPIPGVMPFGTVTLFAGAPGVGKTAMLADWIVRWRDGRSILGYPTNRPTAFYYLAADRQWASHQKWFDAVGFPDIPHYSLADDLDVKLEDFQRPAMALTLFRGALNKLAPIKGAHLFVDPVAPLFVPGDPNKARDVAVGMLQFSRMCQQLSINMTCVAHFGKQKNDAKEQYARPQDRVAGSGAFAGFSDTQIYMIDPQPPKQPFHILGWNPRHSLAEEFHMTRNEQGLFVPFELFKELDYYENLRKALEEDRTYTTAQLLALAQAIFSCSTATAERYVSTLVKDGILRKIRRGIFEKAKVS